MKYPAVAYEKLNVATASRYDYQRKLEMEITF